MTLKKFFFYGLLFLFCFTSCRDDDPVKASAYTQRVNSFIHQMMDYYYFWNTRFPDIDWEYETDSKSYFKKLLVKEDVYSHITDNAEDLLKSLEGIEKTFGYGLSYYWEDESETTVYALVEYVYPGTPAALAGIERGDFIVTLNGHSLTKNNIDELFSSASIKIGVKKYQNGNYTEAKNINLQQASTALNPVYTTCVYPLQNTKIGYLCYLSYIENYNFALDTVFDSFKKAGISELILDLRYNRGGDENAIRNLCSHIAPVSPCRNKEVIIECHYNDNVKKDLQTEGINPNLYFTDTLLNENLNLKRVFVLTSNQTYSASEATILGLQPYMNVIRIGEKTGGKDTGLQLLQPYVLDHDEVVLDPIIKNWAILPIVSRYQNKEGRSATGGLLPDHEVKNSYLPKVPVGDTKDPLIAKALELIGGVSTASVKALPQDETPPPFHHASSVYDKIKENIIKTGL